MNEVFLILAKTDTGHIPVVIIIILMGVVWTGIQVERKMSTLCAIGAYLCNWLSLSSCQLISGQYMIYAPQL